MTLTDLPAAFDILDHSIRLHCCVKNVGNIWQGSRVVFVAPDRVQSVCVNGRVSSQKKQYYGVPQRSDLVPVHFTLYIHSLSEVDVCQLVCEGDGCNVLLYWVVCCCHITCVTL